MRDKAGVFIIAITALLMLCIWPFSLVRKDADVDSMLGIEYGVTEQYITEDAPLTQTFTAQEARLEEICFVVNHNATEASILFTLMDPEGNILTEELVNAEDIGNQSFCSVPVHKWIKKGQTYRYILSVDENSAGMFRGVYTREPEEHATGSEELSIGDVLIGGEAVTRYTYGYSLNVKNVICLWAFLVAVGALFYGMLVKKKPEKNAVWNKLDEILEKYHLIIMIGEILGILLLTVYICRNVALDWDEAYTLRMVTKYSWGEMIQVTASDIHPPLYYMLLRVFCIVFGNEIFALKLFSVLLTGLTMILGMTIIRKNWGYRTAILFNIVVGLGPQFLYYAVNIRMYSMALFFVTLSGLLAYEIIKDNRWQSWIFFVLVSLAGAFTHYFAVVPLAFIYLYLLIGLWIYERKSCKYFFAACVATVLGYIPWLMVVVQSFERFGYSGGVQWDALDLGDLIHWAFDTNIKWSEYIPMLLFAAGIILLVVCWKQYSGRDRLFLIMCASNIFISYIICRLIGSMNNHFWDNRYVFAVLGCFWLFLAILYGNRGRLVFFSSLLCITVLAASTFVVQKQRELGTVPYMQDTYQLLEQVRGEEKILYDYGTYDVLYGAHLREQEFIFFEDLDIDTLEGDHIYYIQWAGQWFSQEMIDKYQIRAEKCGDMRFEEGVAGVTLHKIYFTHSLPSE